MPFQCPQCQSKNISKSKRSRISLTRRFYARQNSDAQEHDRAHDVQCAGMCTRYAP